MGVANPSEVAAHGVWATFTDAPRVARSALAAVIAASIAATLVFAWVVPGGQPYDEPAHWDNVQHYAENAAMPVLGDPGVSYEAQMGPVFYAASAVVAKAASFLDEQDRYLAVRIVGVLVFVPLLLLATFALTMQLIGRRDSWLAGVAAAGFMGLNPLLMAIAASIQNDYLTMVFCTWAVVWTIGLLRSTAAGPDRSRELRRWAGVGLLCGLAVLTKVFALALIPALVLGATAQAMRRRDARALVGASVAVVVSAAVTAWWFIRNVTLYGDVSGRKGLVAAGFDFPPLRLAGVGDLATWGQSLFTYAWLPTEYYRSAFSAPNWLRALLALGSLVVVVALVSSIVRGWRSLIGLDALRVFLVAWIGITFLAYAYLTWRSTALAPRVAFVALPTLVGCVVAVIARFAPITIQRVAAGAVGLCLVVGTVWSATEVVQVPPMPFWFSG